VSIYKDLPYLENADLPSCRYAKACDIRDVLRHAINTARALPVSQMAEVEALLDFGLTHIRSAHDEDTVEEEIKELLAVNPVLDSDDPLDGLCGPAEVEPDASIG
jgi:hypothetical protein